MAVAEISRYVCDRCHAIADRPSGEAAPMGWRTWQRDFLPGEPKTNDYRLWLLCSPCDDEVAAFLYRNPTSEDG